MTTADWSTVDVLALSFKLVLRISQRILIGEPMSRDQELLDCAQGYADAGKSQTLLPHEKNIPSVPY